MLKYLSQVLVHILWCVLVVYGAARMTGVRFGSASDYLHIISFALMVIVGFILPGLIYYIVFRKSIGR